LLFDIKGLALEVEQKSFAYSLFLFWFYMKDCDLVIYVQFLTEPTRVETSWDCWCERVAE
jgi:hypothetical protein